MSVPQCERICVQCVCLAQNKLGARKLLDGDRRYCERASILPKTLIKTRGGCA